MILYSNLEELMKNIDTNKKKKEEVITRNGNDQEGEEG